MEEPHKTHQEPAWGWISVLGKGLIPPHRLRPCRARATHRHLMDGDCAITVAQTERAAP